MLKKFKVFFLLEILGLFLIDQGIKLFINNNHLEAHDPIIDPILYFSPTFNRDLSWFDSMLDHDFGMAFHIVVVLIVIGLIGLFYRYLTKKNVVGNLVDVAFAFLFAGAICSLVDKVFWGGSLDFIQLTGFFTFDLKDVYLNVFIGFFILLLVLDYKGIRKVIL